jgi:hypothetical protein
MDNIYKYHGLLDDIISNRGSQFISKFWQLLFKILKVKIKLWSAYHPQIDGKLERVNQVLEQYLRCTSTTIKTIGRNYYHLPSLRTTTPSKGLFNKSHSLPTIGIIQSLISLTSTKKKIQQLGNLLLDYLRFTHRWRINFLKLKIDKRIMQTSLGKYILWLTLKIRYNYFIVISRKIIHVKNLTSDVLDPFQLLSKSMI